MDVWWSQRCQILYLYFVVSGSSGIGGTGVKEGRRVWIGSTTSDYQRRTMSSLWMIAEALVGSVKQSDGRDRGPTRQARDGPASSQPGSRMLMMSASSERVLLPSGARAT